MAIKKKTKNDSLVFVIFGATGALAKMHLFPALYDLYARGAMPKRFYIIGNGRRLYDDETFRGYVRSILMGHTDGREEAEIDDFLRYVQYHQGSFEETENYQALADRVDGLGVGKNKHNNRIFHLAVPPEHVQMIVSNMKQVGLTKQPKDAWTRVLVEKPFGSDEKTAQDLDTFLGKVFSEEQIFRIDHYLAKEVLQNILTFRFSNDLFESVWNRNHIESVQIYFREQIDVGERGGFFDSVGMLRDVGQNHMLQMLAAIAMENPNVMQDKAIRGEREKVLKALKIPTRKDVKKSMSRGQYQGYKKTKGVARTSQTETFFAVQAFVDNKRWKGVPFYLEGGKGLYKDRVKIRVNFKAVASCICPPEEKEHNHYNSLVFQVKPEEGISVQFWSKAPGFTNQLEPRLLAFKYQGMTSPRIDEDGKTAKKNMHIPDAYERVLYDCIRGDQTLFASTTEVNASWKYITPIVKNWDAVPLQKYKKGSKGPEVRFPNKPKRVYYH